MLKDPVHQSQLYLRRAGRRLRGSSFEATRLDDFDDAERDVFFDSGRNQVSTLVRRIESVTGGPLDSRRALDYGCGVGRMTLPLAERCEHVYGLDVSPAVLVEADRMAQAMNVTNVEWFGAEQLQQLSGRYDLAVSLYVFQHIPSREGERIFSTIVRGLRPGGIGALEFTVRPARPLTGWSRKLKAARAGSASLIRALDFSYPYQLMHSYSLNRLGRLLEDEGITEWHVRWHSRSNAGVTYETATVVFRKPLS